MNKMAQNQNPRMQSLMDACIDISLGTLWLIREDVWKSSASSYDQNSTRICHPGLSIRKRPVRELSDNVPMLLGSTGENGPLVYFGLSAVKSSSHPTSFGRLLAPISVEIFTHKAPDAVPDLLAGPWYKHSQTCPNFHKPRLNTAEENRLVAWVKAKNIL